MARKSRRPNNEIIVKAGNTYAVFDNVYIFYSERPWIIKLNPQLIPPALRRDGKMNVTVDGRRVGFLEQRYGCIPSRRNTTKRGLVGFIQRKLGFMLQPYQRGYVQLNIGRFKYFVVSMYADDGSSTHEMRDLKTGTPVGRITFTADMSYVYLNPLRDGVVATLCVVAGHMARRELFSKSAIHANGNIKILM